jgi:hypothetical protein
MEAKLTLKIDKMAIDSAKRYAQRHNRSLSGMVENYFKNLSSDYTCHKKHSPVVESLTGVLTENELEKFAEEDERIRYILGKES